MGMSRMPDPARDIDGAEVEILRARLGSVAEEMRTTLKRTAFSPVIYEVLDFGISVYDANLDLIAEAPGLARFLGANDFAVPTVIRHVGADTLNPGDVVMTGPPGRPDNVKEGDVMEVEIAEIGTLSNPVVNES